MKKNLSIAFDAQVFWDLCKNKKIQSCAIVTSLKKNDEVYSFCKKLSYELNLSGKNVVFCERDVSLTLSADSFSLILHYAPNPNKDAASYHACKSCDAVLIVEKYGSSLHYAFDEMVVFLREHSFNILGVFGIK